MLKNKSNATLKKREIFGPIVVLQSSSSMSWKFCCSIFLQETGQIKEEKGCCVGRLIFCHFLSKLCIPRTIKTRKNLVLLLFVRLGRQGSTENFCYFAKYPTFEESIVAMPQHIVSIYSTFSVGRLIFCHFLQKKIPVRKWPFATVPRRSCGPVAATVPCDENGVFYSLAK